MTATHAQTYEDKLADLSKEFWSGSGHNIKEYEEHKAPPAFGPIVINGITMSRVALDQLRKQGLPLEWYTSDELEDAVVACSADARLIDDPLGDGLRDKLSLDPDEMPNAISALHGFHPDEFSKTSDKPLTPNQKYHAQMEALLPDCVKEDIKKGLSLIENPTTMRKCDHLSHGLDSAPHRINRDALAVSA